MIHSRRTIRLFMLICLFGALILYAENAMLFQDPSAPIKKRIDDLIGRLTLEEKVSLMSDDAAGERQRQPCA